MALFLRGQTWWFEYRTRNVRIVKSTGFRKPDKAKANAVYQAFRIGVGVKPQRSAMEKMLAAIYDDIAVKERGFPLACVWAVYEDWFSGKAKKVSRSTWLNHRNETARVVAWASERGCTDISDVSAAVARDYVRRISPTRSNKTVRNIVLNLSTVWEAVGQIHPGIHNPWRAACPDKDGSAIRRPHFTPDEADRVLQAAKDLGHGWHLASMIALHTGLRYGDIANLDWSCVNLEERVIVTRPRKTRDSSGVTVTIPIAEPLFNLLNDGGVGFVLQEHAMRYNARSRLEVTFSDVLLKAGLVGTHHTFHSWRHTFRTRLAAAGVSTEVAMLLCGHTTTEMSRHYDHTEHIGELRAAIDAATIQ